MTTPSDAQVEQAARRLAYDVWPLAPDDERSKWAIWHWKEWEQRARAALTVAAQAGEDSNMKHGPFHHVTQEEKDTCPVLWRKRHKPLAAMMPRPASSPNSVGTPARVQPLEGAFLQCENGSRSCRSALGSPS